MFVKIMLSIAVIASYITSVRATELTIDTTYKSENFRSREGKKVEALLLHCVGLADDWVLKNYVLSSEKGGLGVSAHYYISESGKIYQLVPNDFSAFHAGPSEWDGLAQKKGLKGLNDLSIGIEFQSLGYAQVPNKEGYFPCYFRPYQETQIDLGISLCKNIMKEHKIPREKVLWHSDVSPLRKTDPGPSFPGEYFAEKGVGVWPLADRIEDTQLDTSLLALQQQLKTWGYPLGETTGKWDDATKHTVQAHYMHYLPKSVPWEKFQEKTSGSIFDGVKSWDELPYDKATLFISLENLNNKHYKYK